MIIPLGLLNEMEVDEKTGDIYHEKLFNLVCIGRIPAVIAIILASCLHKKSINFGYKVSIGYVFWHIVIKTDSGISNLFCVSEKN